LLRVVVPGTASEAVAWLERAQDGFVAAVAELPPEGFDELRPAHWGEHVRLSTLVGLIEFEHTHHGAEISLLRDLRRGAAQIKQWPRLSG